MGKRSAKTMFGHPVLLWSGEANVKNNNDEKKNPNSFVNTAGLIKGRLRRRH